MGAEMLINALLKTLGFDKAEFMRQFAVVKKELEVFKERAENSEARLIDVQMRLAHIGLTLDKIAAQADDFQPGGNHFTAHNTLEN